MADQRTPEEQLALIFRHAAEAEGLEHQAVDAAVGQWQRQLQELTQEFARRWVREFGDLAATVDPERAAALTTWLRGQLADLPVDPTRALVLWGGRALVLGVVQAGAELNDAIPIPVATRTVAAVHEAFPRTLRQRIRDAIRAAVRWIKKWVQRVRGEAADRMRVADRLLATVRVSKHDEVVPALAAAHQAATGMKRAAGWLINREVNDGMLTVSNAVFADSLWVAERDACVHCLAYSGHIAAHGESFEIGLTFGRQPLLPWPDPEQLPGPPLHPHCRCRITPWLGHNTAGALEASIPGWQKGLRSATTGMPEALQREARRSVLKGWSLESESEGVRLDAAARLLARGANLPKSVETEARRAVREGKFRSRTVPG